MVIPCSLCVKDSPQQMIGVRPCSKAFNTFLLTVSSVSAKYSLLSEWPMITYFTPASVSILGEISPVTDANGLQAVKVTFDSGILFNTSSSALSSNATASLAKFASTVLNVNKDMDVAIKGYTDNQGWKNSTAAQSVQKNMDLSLQRANSVSNYLKQCGVSPTQITSVEGLGEADPVADNSTAAGREQNRRVEVYLYASEKMIQEAQAQAGN